MLVVTVENVILHFTLFLNDELLFQKCSYNTFLRFERSDCVELQNYNEIVYGHNQQIQNPMRTQYHVFIDNNDCAFECFCIVRFLVIRMKLLVAHFSTLSPLSPANQARRTKTRNRQKYVIEKQ